MGREVSYRLAMTTLMEILGIPWSSSKVWSTVVMWRGRCLAMAHKELMHAIMLTLDTSGDVTTSSSRPSNIPDSSLNSEGMSTGWEGGIYSHILTCIIIY